MDDETRLRLEIEKSKQKWDQIDYKVDKLTREIYEEEEDSDDPEESSELSKELRKIEGEKDKMIGASDVERDKSLFDDNNPHKDNSLLLAQLKSSLDYDLASAKLIESELPDSDRNYDKSSKLVDTIEKQIREVSTLTQEWHSRDLAPIVNPAFSDTNPDNNRESNSPGETQGETKGETKGNSSLLDDFADTSTEPTDYFGGDD